MMKIVIALVLLVFTLPLTAQEAYEFESSYLPSGVAYRFKRPGLEFQRSTDHGKTWTTVHSQLIYNNKEYGSPWGAMMSTVLHFINDSTGFAIGGVDCYQYRDYILRTSDGGKTWKKVLSLEGLGSHFTYEGNRLDKPVHFSDPGSGMLLLAFHPKEITIARTKDGGSSWKLDKLKVPEGYGFQEFIFSALKGEMHFKNKENEIKKMITSDGGRTWKWD